MTGDTKDPPAVADASVAEEAVEQEGGAPKKPSTGGLKKGPWTSAEDEILVAYVKKHGEGNWNRVQRNTGLARCGKSCRLRWANHLRPNLKKGSFSRAEEELILRLHAQMGNKWARMALQLPGRTDNEIKNFWNTRIKRLQRAGQPVYPPEVYNPPIPMSTPPIGFIPDKPKFTARRPPPLLDTITFGGPPNAGMSAMPPLQRGPYMGPLSFPFSPIGPPSTPTSLFQPPPQQQLQQQQQAAQMSFGLGSCDATLPPPLMPSFSPKMELPSSQFIYSDPQISGTIAAGPGDLHLQDVGTATIPDEFKFPHLFPDELHTTVEKDSGWSYIGGGGADGLFPIDGCGGGGIDASMMNSNLESDIKPGFLGSDFDYGINAKYEPAGIPNPMHDDLSSICSVSNMDMMQISECDNINDIRQISNVKSSAMNVDLFSLGTDPLDSSLSIAPVDQDWSFDSCPWSNMPGIC